MFVFAAQGTTRLKLLFVIKLCTVPKGLVHVLCLPNKILCALGGRAVTRALIGGGGCIFIYSCSARLISFEINLKTTDFKRNSSGIIRIYEYTLPPPPN